MKRPRAVGAVASAPQSSPPFELPPSPGIGVSALPFPPGWRNASLGDLVRADLAAAPARHEARLAQIDACRSAAIAFDSARIDAAREIEAAAGASATPGDWGYGLDIRAEAWVGAPQDRKPGGRTGGRPLLGATSAALYIAAEHAAGAPPRLRDRWRHVVGPGADGVDGRGSAAGGVLDPARAAALREELKRPAWPDRAFPHALFAAAQRPIAIAASFDAAATDLSLADALAQRTLAALLREEDSLAAAPLPSDSIAGNSSVL